jgi:hypothetical protein
VSLGVGVPELSNQNPVTSTKHPVTSNMKNFTNEQIVAEPMAVKAWAEKRTIFVLLHDGRILGFPADRFKILKEASEEQLKEVEIRLNGYALRWENIDEDLTVKGIIAGNFQLPLEG